MLPIRTLCPLHFPFANQRRILHVSAVPSSPGTCSESAPLINRHETITGRVTQLSTMGTEEHPGFSGFTGSLPPPTTPTASPPPPSPGPGRPLRTFSCSLTAGMQQNHKGSSLLKKTTQTATASHASPAWRVGASAARSRTHARLLHSSVHSFIQAPFVPLHF